MSSSLAVSKPGPVPEPEIERCFLIDPTQIPYDLSDVDSDLVRQRYLSFAGPNQDEVRIRQEGNRLTRDTKSDGTLERDEAQEELSCTDFEKEWADASGRPEIVKTRYCIPHDGHTLLIDQYHGALEGKWKAEVEFKSRSEAEAFATPAWFGEDVTSDPRFRNGALARDGWPESSELSFPASAPPRLALDEGVSHTLQEIRIRLSAGSGCVVVVVAGGSGSGKTSAVASKIKDAFGDDCRILSMDDYSKGNIFIEQQRLVGKVITWDHPEYVDSAMVSTHLHQLKSGAQIMKPTFSFKTGEPSGAEIVEPAKVIVVEGLFALHDSLKGAFDYGVFVDIGAHGRAMRRLFRDVHRTNMRPDDILKYFAEVVEPLHQKFIQPTAANADLVIENEYRADIEAHRSGLTQTQVKLEGSLDPETLRRAGAEFLGNSLQQDLYLEPKDRDFSKTGELLRLRKEGDQYLLTYKGPLEPGEAVRPKFEMLIEEELGESIRRLYNGNSFEIDKQRVSYLLNGVIVSVDTDIVVSRRGITAAIPGHVELRATQDKVAEIDEAISTLGLDGRRLRTRSYAEF